MSVYPPAHLATARRQVPKAALGKLTMIPGIGPSMAADLYLLGIREVRHLKSLDPERLYQDLCALAGQRVDRCVLYVFRCAVYYASQKHHSAEKLKWWNWKG